MREVIYQLFVRHFSNLETAGSDHGDRASNGCGSFDAINDAALASLSRFGITHIWLTGVIKHATQSTYGGQESVSESLVKGKAGSPYAISDYFDVDADLATVPANRMQEFESLIERIRRWGMIPLIDFVPNHVSRDYKAVDYPELDFSASRHDRTPFFTRDQPYYYLEEGPEGRVPFRLPLGVYHDDLIRPRVTGNNAATWRPTLYDWYETVKLNYGVDYRLGARACETLPDVLASPSEVPRTWRIMDRVLAFWQRKGVGGFRCDMAHMVPMQYWRWASARCRLRDESCLLIAEAYDDHMKLVEGDVQSALLNSGFDAVYDAPSYEALRALYEREVWANDLDCYNSEHTALSHRGVRYLENHDEPRLCSPLYWGGKGEIVREALSVAQYATSRGPILFYNGQELGERAEGPIGFGGNQGRTSIFDYTSLPRLQRWVHGHRYDGGLLTEQEHAQREWMGELLRLMQSPAFTQGGFYGLNWANQQTAGFGRAEGEQHSGHWVYAFLRYDRESGACYLALCHLAAESAQDEVCVHIPEHAQQWCRREHAFSRFTPMLGSDAGASIELSREQLLTGELRYHLPAGRAQILRWD